MILRSFCLAVSLLCASVAAAQPLEATGEVSDKTLKTLKALAWQSLPSRITQSDKAIVEIDKSDPSKIVIPDADAREIIREAHLTARAHKCELQDLVIANRDALLLREKKPADGRKASFSISTPCTFLPSSFCWERWKLSMRSQTRPFLLR